MKIQSLFVSNFLGVAAVDVSTQATVQLFAGKNGAGKSSLRDAIALALTADLGRVSQKKEAAALVRKGADAAVCEVTDVDGDSWHVSITAAGKIADSKKGKEPDPMLPYVLDAQRFARLDANERRAFMFGLMRIKMDGPSIVARLVKRELDKSKVDRIAPILRSGFPAACTEAKSKATEAKGAWRSLTGETYGSEKAKTWRAPAPAHDPKQVAALSTELTHANTAIESWLKEVGKLQAEQARHDQQRAKVAGLRDQVDKLPRITEKLAKDQSELVSWEADVAKTAAAAGTGKRVGLIHDLAAALAYCLSFENPLAQRSAEEEDAYAALQAYETEHGKVGQTAGDEAARARLPSIVKSRDLLASAVANGKRDLDAATKAKAELDTILAEPAPDIQALDNARSQADDLKKQRAEITAKLDAQKTLKAQADAAEKKTQDAQTYHADVAAWDAIADALAPDGIPGEILSEALGPINERLASSAVDTDWLRAVVGPDMAVTGDGRDYRLLSESEKWRVDAMLAEAIGYLSGTRLLVLDRFDVLDPAGRSQLLGWLDVLADTGEVDSALIFGTLKALPANLPPTIATHWIENGVVAQLKEAA